MLLNPRQQRLGHDRPHHVETQFPPLIHLVGASLNHGLAVARLLFVCQWNGAGLAPARGAFGVGRCAPPPLLCHRTGSSGYRSSRTMRERDGCWHPHGSIVRPVERGRLGRRQLTASSARATLQLPSRTPPARGSISIAAVHAREWVPATRIEPLVHMSPRGGRAWRSMRFSSRCLSVTSRSRTVSFARTSRAGSTTTTAPATRRASTGK